MDIIAFCLSYDFYRQKMHTHNKLMQKALKNSTGRAEVDRLALKEMPMLNTVLTARDAQMFLTALDRPVVFNPALTAAMGEHARRVVSL